MKDELTKTQDPVKSSLFSVPEPALFSDLIPILAFAPFFLNDLFK